MFQLKLWGIPQVLESDGSSGRTRTSPNLANNGSLSECPLKPRLPHRPAAAPFAPSFSFSFPAR